MQQIKQENFRKLNRVGRVLFTIVEILLCVVLIPILIVNATLVIKNAIHPNDVPDVFGYTPIISQTDNMQPLIGNNDLVIIQKVDSEGMQMNDVIAYSSSNEIKVGRIADRIQTESSLHFQITTDQTATEEIAPVAASQVVGAYRTSFKGMGAFALFLQSPVGIICFVVLPLVLIMAYEEIKKIYRKKRDKKEAVLQQEEEEPAPALHD